MWKYELTVLPFASSQHLNYPDLLFVVSPLRGCLPVITLPARVMGRNWPFWAVMGLLETARQVDQQGTHIRHKWRYFLFILQGHPVHRPKPWVLLELFKTLCSRFACQAFRRFSLKQLERQYISQSGNRIAYHSVLTAFSACIPARLHFFSQSSGNFKGSFEMLCVKSLLVFPRKGRRPKISSYATTPSDHQSML